MTRRQKGGPSPDGGNLVDVQQGDVVKVSIVGGGAEDYSFIHIFDRFWNTLCMGGLMLGQRGERRD